MSGSVVYRVSFVVEGGMHHGTMVTLDREPELGEEVTFDGLIFEVTEVEELIAPVDDFGFLHVTCRYLRPAK